MRNSLRPILRVLISTALAASCVHAVDVMENVAGIAAPGYSGDGAPATSAKINGPLGVIEDGSGNIYFCDGGNGCIRRVDAASGNISTIAGTGVQGFSGDTGPATAAQLHSPAGIVFDKSGNLYIADQGNNRVRKVDTGGTITTIAGNGNSGFSGDNGLATSAAVYTPSEVQIDPIDGSLVISQLNASAIRRVDLTTNNITTICGNGTSSDYNGDNILAVNAHLNNPTGIRFDKAGNLCIVDCLNERVRLITRATGMISTVAGTGQFGFSGDNGQASAATFGFGQSPTVGGDLSLDANGNIFLCDTINQRIRYIDDATQIVTTIAGNGMPGYGGNFVDAQNTSMNLPAGIFAEANGNYLISDNLNNVVRRVVRNSQTLPFAVNSISPNHGGNTGVVTPTVSGSGFVDGATVVLHRNGSTDIAASPVRNRFGLGLQATFNLNGVSPGVYDVIVTLPSMASRTLAGAFTVENGGPTLLSVDVIGNDRIRGGKQQAYEVVCSNGSDTDQYMIPLVVTFPTFCTFQPGFPVMHPTVQPDGGPALDFTQVPLVISTKDTNIVQLLIPVIPAGGVRAYTMRFTSADTSNLAHLHFNIGASLGQPLLPSAIQTMVRAQGTAARDAIARDLSADACFRNIINTSFTCAGLILPLDCAQKVYTLAAKTFVDFVILFNDPTSTRDDAVGNFQDVVTSAVQTALSCAGSSIPGLSQLLKITSAIKCGQGIAKAIACGNPDNSANKNVESIVSGDPNDKSGPDGPGDAKYIPRGTPMTYFIQFENKPEATASAQTVIITDPLDTTNLDMSTLSLGIITFADQVITPPPGLSSFTTDVDLRPGKNLIVRITVGLQSGTLRWEFDSIDPATNQPTTDPVLGFLDPNVTPPQGDGGVMYTLQQKPNLAAGTVISNKATIVFDANSPIDTPTWSNTIALLGSDTDNDGFPDELETAAGSDPFNPLSTPLGAGTFPPQALDVSKLGLKLDFSGKGKDSLQFTAQLDPLPASNFTLKGQLVQVFVSGVYRKFTLDDKGKAQPVKTESASIKSGKTGALLSVKINEAISSKFAEAALDASADIKAPAFPNRSLLAIVLFNGTYYKNTVPIVYSSKKGKSGSATL